MDLKQTNDCLRRLGYLEIDEQRAAVLVRCIPKLGAWIDDCLGQGEASDHWQDLRSALFAMSAPCRQVLQRVGLRPDDETVVRTLVSGGRGLRLQFARVFKTSQGGAGTPEAEEAIRRAFGGALSRDQAKAPMRVARGPEAGRGRVHHIYGSTAALAIEHATTRDGGRSCVQVEAAAANGTRPGYMWQEKIALQLTEHEVLELIATLCGDQQRATFRHHGPDRDKSVDVVAQGDRESFLVAVRRGATSRVIPVPKFHAFRIVALAVETVVANEPMFSSRDVLAMARTLSRRFEAGAR